MARVATTPAAAETNQAFAVQQNGINLIPMSAASRSSSGANNCGALPLRLRNARCRN